MASISNRKWQVPTRIAIAILVPVGALAAVGCGGGGSDSTLSKAQVISQGGAICREAENRVNQLPQVSGNPFAPGTSAKERQQARAFLRGYADALQFSREGLAKLDAPERDRNLLQGYLAATGKVVDELRTAASAPPQQALADAQRAFKEFDQASKQTAKYGFPKGVCQAGSNS